MDKPIETKPPLPTRVHPSDRGRIAASNAVARLSGIVPMDGPDVSYYSPELIQCTLPHSDPKSRDWIRRNGNFTLIVSSGIDEDGIVLGIPYGSFPRLMLAHIITRVIETRERRIDLGTHFGTFLRDIGYTGNNRGNIPSARTIRAQLLRLLRAHISFQYNEDNAKYKRLAVRDVKISPKFDLWWNFKKPEEGSLFGSWIDLSEEFYQSILQSPVPLRTDILKALRKSPLALDVYMWVSYRLFAMQAAGQPELRVPIGALQAQFGTGTAEENYRQFRQQLKHAFAKVAALWKPLGDENEKSLLNYEIDEGGLILYRSPLLIAHKQPTKQEDAARILETRSFDAATLKRAKQLAGNWDLNYLIRQYFQWIDDYGIKAEDPRRLFLSFIKKHVETNGKG